jgi:guanylate kinase
MAGRLVIVSAPSGAGKTTIVKRLLEAGLGLEFSVSACSRPKRPNETDGIDYYFITAETFKEKIRNNEFLEWQEVYTNQLYGTLKSEVARIRSNGHHAIFDVDVIGGINIKKAYPQISLAIFISPPSLEVLEERLRNRHTESEESIRKRLAKASLEMSYAGRFDRVIINSGLETAVKEAIEITGKFLNSRK